MQVFVEPFWLEKAGNSPEEYEDSFAWSSSSSERHAFLAAIADGASSGMLSGSWSRILTQAICHAPIPLENLDFILDEATNTWNSWLQEYYQAREEQNRPIRWYEEPGLEAGAYSTLCVFSAQDGESPRWQALAIGDSCLFQLRRHQIITCFPLASAQAFNNAPALLSSSLQNRQNLEEHILQAQGDWQNGDQFFLMTDALARFFLDQLQSGPDILADLELIHTTEDFSVWINSLRIQKQIHNDDVTFLRISLF